MPFNNDTISSNLVGEYSGVQVIVTFIIKELGFPQKYLLPENPAINRLKINGSFLS
jgi:hypothetical protein